MTEREFAALRVLLKNSYTVGASDVELRNQGARPAFQDADDYATHTLSIFRSLNSSLGLDKG
jgi:uncharacterized tellurite resistance protein B-like protein